MASMAGLHDEQALLDNVTEYIHGYLDTRLILMSPEGEIVAMKEKNPELYQAFFEVAVDMFEAGAAWGDVTSEREGKQIITC